MQVFQIKNNYLQHQRTHTMDKAVHLQNLLNGNRPIIFYLLLTSFTSSLAKLEISSLFIFVFCRLSNTIQEFIDIISKCTKWSTVNLSQHHYLRDPWDRSQIHLRDEASF